MSFVAFAQACGVIVDRLVSDGRIHRCGTAAHPRSKNGAYAFDGTRGWVMAWDATDQVQWFSDPNAKPWTADEKRQWMARRDAERRDQERRHQRAAKTAETMLRACQMQEHGYLRLKGFPKLKALVSEDETLFVPMRNLRTNALQGAQTIRWDDEARKWVKKMLYGTRAKAAVFRLGNARDSVLCEGFATGLSIDAAIKQMSLAMSVLVCFSAQNMAHVAEQLGRGYVFADNDASGTGEAIAKQIGRPYCMAPVVGWDANDWHMAQGLTPLCVALMELRREERIAA